MLGTYYRLTKPGIIYGNVLTAAAGYLLATRWRVEGAAFLSLLVGTGLIIASGCVLNNYLDREIDAKMARTKKRALVTGAVSVRHALVYAALLGVAGFVVLARTNGLTMWIGGLGIFSYIVLYGLAKRRTVYGTLVGTVPGAASLVAGYTAATNRLDGDALILFLIMVTWQLPHFYAIATYRLQDYAAAGLPVWPVKRGVRSTKTQIVVFIALFVVASLLLTVKGYTGYMYAVVMAAVGAYWFWTAVRGWRAHDEAHWGRQTFFLSLVVLLSLSVMMPVGAILP